MKRLIVMIGILFCSMLLNAAEPEKPSNGIELDGREETFNIDTPQAKKGDILDQITKKSKEQLKKFWDAFDSEEFKKKAKLHFKEELGIPLQGLQYQVQKGISLKGATPDPTKTKEGGFLKMRMPIAEKALLKYTGIPKFTDDKEVPRIACAFSGGGYRAMILTSGYLKALEDLGLIDAVLYCSTLSGSTWYLGPWTFQQEPALGKKTTVSVFNQLIIDKIKSEHFDLKNFKRTKEGFDVPFYASNIIWPKILFDQVISSVDIYGAALAHLLLADLAKDEGKGKDLLVTLKDQLKNVELGNHPWPIYTAVSIHKSEDEKSPYRYNWYEFNPEYVRNLEYDLAIDSFSYGSKFENGKCTDVAPPQSFGFFMGTFGSAYTVHLTDIIRILFGGLAQYDAEQEKMLHEWFPKESKDWARAAIGKIQSYYTLAKNRKFKEIYDSAVKDLKQTQAALLVRFLGFVQDYAIQLADNAGTVNVKGKEIKVKSARFSPAQVFNPFKGYAESNLPWLKEKEFLTFVDAGIDYNIPLRPLFRPERDIDIVIIGEASGDAIAGTPQLDLALKDIKRFYDLDYVLDKEKSDMTMKIYKCTKSYYPNAAKEFKDVVPPIVIYFTFLKDKELLDKFSQKGPLKNMIEDNRLYDFDAVKCLSDGYCGTYNFAYSVNDYKQLSGIGEFNIRAHDSALRDLIGDVASERKDTGGWRLYK